MLMLLPVLLAAALALSNAARITPGTTNWKPPTAPSAFHISASMNWAWEGGLTALDNVVPVTIARYGDDLGISYPELGYSAFMPVLTTSNSTAYSLQWWGNTSGASGQTHNCSSIPGGYSYWGSQVFASYWAVLNAIDTTAPWQYAGELIHSLPSGNKTVTGVVWRKIASATSVFTIVVDAATQAPKSFKVQTSTPPNFLNNFFLPNSVADDAYSFTVLKYSTNNRGGAIRKAARLPASINPETDCTYFPGYAPSPPPSMEAPGASAGPGAVLGSSSWAPDWKTADHFFSAKAMGLANLTGVTNLTQVFTDLYPHWHINYTAGPIEANASAPFSLADIGSSFTIKQQGMCGDCYAVGSMTALETAIIVQSGAAAAANASSSSSGAAQLAAPLLSAQFLIDCTPPILPLLDLNLYSSGLGGCNGGMPHQVYEFIIQEGGVIPLSANYPYVAIGGKCRHDSPGFQTHLSHFMSVNTPGQLINALVNYGAVVTLVSAFPWATTVTLPGQASPCAPIQGPEDPNLDHVVIVVGWQGCQLPNGTNTQCWIIQNSWGVNAGWQGFFFVPMDLASDCGVLSSTLAIVPVLKWPKQ